MGGTQHVVRRVLSAIVSASVAAPVVVLAVAVPAAAAATPLYPDLKTLAPRELRFDRADVTPELSGVFHNVLRFSNTTFNVGQGPLLLNAPISPTTRSGPSTQRVMNTDGTYTDYALNNDIYWHEAHHHYHFDNWGDYQLWSKSGYDAWLASGRTSGAPLYTGTKTTSCVVDEEFVASVPRAVYPGPYGLAGCDSGANWQIRMGLAVGWGDTYDWYRQDQWVDLGQDTLGDGTYVLRSVADPLNIVYESANRADTARENIAGNEAATTFIVRNGNLVDSDAPSGTVTINHVDQTTTTPKVKVSVAGRDDVSEPSHFRLSNDGSHWATFTYTSSGSVPTTVAWNLADATTGGSDRSGTRKVYARVRDHSGKWGSTFTDTIDYRPGAPPPPSGSYADVVKADHPAGYWRLDERSGHTARDSSGDNHGTYRGGVRLGRPSLLVRDHDAAASFAGSGGQNVAIPSSGPLSPQATVSVEAWIKPVTVPKAGKYASIVTKPESYSLQLDGSRIEFTVMESGARHRLKSARSVVLGRTYHVVGTYNGVTSRLYVNGKLVTAKSFNEPITTNANDVHIGSWDGSKEFFRGAIDEPAVYPQTLKASQVTRHYSAGTNPAKPVQSTLTVAKRGPGSGAVLSSPSGISCGARCAASYIRGTRVTVAARPASDAKFAGWSGGGCHGTGACTFTLRADTTVHAQFVPLPAYPKVVQGDAPAAYWRLDDSSGPAARDSAGSNDGTYRGARPGAPGLIALRPNAAAVFSGHGQYLRARSSSALAPTRRVSVEAWVRPASLPKTGSAATIVAKPGSYALQVVGNRAQFTIIRHGERRRVQSPAGAIAVGRTSHVIGTYDGSVQRLFVDGKLVVAAGRSGPITANTKPVLIGSWDGHEQFFRGIIDEVAVYRNAVSPDHVHLHESRGRLAMTAHSDAEPRGRSIGAGTVGAPVALDAALNRISRACDAVDACIEIVDATTHAPIARVPVVRSWRPPTIAVDPTRHLVYVASAVFDPAGARGVVTVVDGRRAAVVATIAVGPGPQSIAVDPTRNRVYVSGQTGVDTDAAVTVVDGATRRIVTTVPIGPYARYYDNPAGLAVDVATHTVYATNPLQGVVYEIDGATGTVVRSFTVGDAPHAVAVDPATGSVAVATKRGVVLLRR